MREDVGSARRRSGIGVGGDAQDPEVEALQQDIERTRAQLGDTVEALAAKADIKGRAERAASQAAARRVRRRAMPPSRYGRRE